MYKKSISEVKNYLLPFVEGIKYLDSDEIEHGLGTMIVINENGDILTCKHIAQRFIINDKLKEIYPKILLDIKNNDKREVLKKYGLGINNEVLTKIDLPFKINGEVEINIKFHEYLDLALIRVNGLKFELSNYPIFSKKLPEIGQSVCKIGYAFPEYNLFKYSKEENDIIIADNVKMNFPLFPIDGIVTRLIMDDKNILSMFETSSPGIRGQSGGPIFGPDGVVYGIQSMTKHMDLNFDIDGEVKRGNAKKHVTYTPFINLGVGISSHEVIKFLEKNKVSFQSK